MKASVKLQGGTDLVKRLRQLPDALSLKVQRDALRAGAEPMRADAAARAPRGEHAPHLADNIVIAIAPKGLEDVSDDEAAVVMGPRKEFFYGYFLEYGTVKMGMHPFMRPAFDTQVHSSLFIIGQKLWDGLRKLLPGSFGSSAKTGGGLL